MPSDAKPVSLLYRGNLAAEIGRLRVMYEPRPTPWFGQAPEEQDVTTEQWVAIFAAEGVGLDEFRSAVQAWVTHEGGERFPAPLDLMRIVARVRRGEARAIPVERVMCDGSGWRPGEDGGHVPCGRCNPALAAVWADPETFARWKSGVSLADLDVGVEERRGVLRYIIPLNLDKPCTRSLEDDVFPGPAAGLAIARRAYAAECDAQGREPSWEHFDSLIAVAAGRRPPVEAFATVE